jgi:hypothetical protein
LFCGGDSSDPDHRDRCDGRQGHIEATDLPDLPMLMSGLVEATYATSTAAAVSVEDLKATQRLMVLHAIKAAGTQGRTDDELQSILNLDGSSERPRRWELWKLEQIRILRDERGEAVKRLTRTNRRAVVWVAA